MTKRRYLSIKVILLIGLIVYILLSLATVYYLASCIKPQNATYIFRDQRGQFEAIVDFLEQPRDAVDTDTDGVDDSVERGKEDAEMKDKVPGCDCDGLGLPAEQPTPTKPGFACPEQPPDLKGRLDISANITPAALYNRTALSLLTPGGAYTPRDCSARETLAVIIPYRDRPRHLKVLLFHLHTVLQRQQLEYAIFVVEMALPVQFNRGLLANVGFLTAHEARRNFTCYVIHDVDQLPADDRNLYRCSRYPRHLAVSSSKYGYKLPYGHYNGGTMAFRPDQYIRVNGFSNSYFGWGKEDDDMHKRILAAKYKVDRPDPDIGVYIDIPHDRYPTNQDNPMKNTSGLTTPAQLPALQDNTNRAVCQISSSELPGTVPAQESNQVCEATATQIDAGGEGSCQGQGLQTLDIGDIYVDLAIKEKAREFVTQLFPDETPRREPSGSFDWRRLSAKVFPVGESIAAIKSVSVDRLEQISSMFCVESAETAAMRRLEDREKIANGQCRVSGTAARAGNRESRSARGTYFGEVFSSGRLAQITDLFCVESPAEAVVRRSEYAQKTGSVANCKGRMKVKEDNGVKRVKKNAVLRFCQRLKRAVTGK